MAPVNVTVTMLRRISNGVPVSGDVMAVIVSLVSIAVLSSFLFTLAIYVDSWCFVFATAVLQQSFGVNSSAAMCSGAILLCLICYVTTKLIYIFLVEKAYIIRNTTKRRLQSKLYLFNSCGMLGVYLVVAILNFIFRITRMENGQCIIGMKHIAMIPLISFDFVVNVYLTVLFLIPLKNLYSFKNMPRSPANVRLRNVAFRTFVGAVCTLISSVVNLTVLMALNGEPGWVCLMCCNCDILFSAIVIQWVTSKDNAGSGSPNNSSLGSDSRRGNRGSTADPPLQQAGHHLSPLRHSASIASTDARSLTRTSSDNRSDDVKVLTSPGSVFVTTTIRHQSVPSGGGTTIDAGTLEDGLAYGGYSPRRGSFDASRNEASSTSRTRISGGAHKEIKS